MLMINKFIALPFIIFIKFYQLIISPLLGSNCRYLPTCSEYAIESIKRFGLLKGFYFSIKRILIEWTSLTLGGSSWVSAL